MTSVLLQHVQKIYPGGVPAVRELDLHLPEGCLTVLAGPSGCGKTTTLRLIAGLETVTDGQIFFGEEEVTHWPPWRRQVGLVFQRLVLLPHLTVRQNLLFPHHRSSFLYRWFRHFLGSAAPVDLSTCEEMAERLGITSLLDRYPAELSGGEAQRVALARAWLRQPKVLLLDEPLSHLDSPFRQELLTQIHDLHQKERRTTLHVTHDPVEALALAERLAIMENGKIQQVGTPRQLLSAPATLFVADFLAYPTSNRLHGFLLREGEQLVFVTEGIKLPLPERVGHDKIREVRSVTAVLLPRALSPICSPPSSEMTAAECAMAAEYNQQGSERTELRGLVKAVQPHPDYLLVRLSCGSLELVMRCSPHSYQTQGNEVQPSEGMPMQVAIDAEHVHIFDSETGKALAFS